MNLAQVKLVVTDMDGTLLNSRSQVSGRFYELYQALQNHGVHFVAASGRQCNSIQDKLSPIVGEISIVAENGGYILHGGKELDSVLLEGSRVRELVRNLRSVPEIHTVVCGKRSAYIEAPDPRFVEILGEYYTRFDIVEDLTAMHDDDFFKVAIYHFESSELGIYPHVKHLERELQVKVSGTNWVDISDPRANKGYAVALLQDRLSISKEQTMVFGDFNNDLEMLERAYFSYAMANAHDNVKRAARFSTTSNDQLGVEMVLEQLLKAKESKSQR